MEPQLNDPVFYDESDYVKCEVCGDEYDHNEYNSLTCMECENKQAEREKLNAKADASSL